MTGLVTFAGEPVTGGCVSGAALDQMPPRDDLGSTRIGPDGRFRLPLGLTEGALAAANDNGGILNVDLFVSGIVDGRYRSTPWGTSVDVTGAEPAEQVAIDLDDAMDLGPAVGRCPD